MLKKNSIPLLFLGILSLLLSTERHSLAEDEPGTREYREIIRDLEDTQKTVRKTGQLPSGCDWSESTSCSYDFFCEKMQSKGNELYLYQDPHGHQLPNLLLTTALKTAEACFNTLPAKSKVSDPFTFPEQTEDAAKAGGSQNLQKNLENFAKQAARVTAIFEEAKVLTEKALEKRRTPENSEQIDKLLTRVRTVGFTPPRPGQNIYELSMIGCEMPNALYQVNSHKLIICPQLLNLPDASLFGAIAHELGHAVDPCMLSLSFGKLDGGRFYMNKRGFDRDEEGTVLPSLPNEKAPFNNVVSCLESNESIGARTPGRDQLVGALDLVIKNSAFDPRLSNKRDLIASSYDKIKYCSFWTGSQMQEAAADWMGAQTLAEKLSGLHEPARAKSYAFESQMVIMGLSCPQVKQANRLALRDLDAKISPKCRQFRDLKFMLLDSPDIPEDTHPRSADRINRIIYAKPEIQKAMGCRPDPANNGKECM
jgi:hypothetical protein